MAAPGGGGGGGGAAGGGGAVARGGGTLLFLLLLALRTDSRPADEAEVEDVSSGLRGPYFDTSASRNVTALVGKTAYLNCRVRNLGNRTVTWIRHRDIHLLTVGRYTYTSDQRFQSLHSPQTEDWMLQIRYPQRRDSGVYECQVSTTPPIGHSMYLSVVEPVTTIVGEPDMYIYKGSTINLTCIVKHSPEPPPAIVWTHNTQEINYDSPRGGVSVITEKGDVTTSYLLIQRADSPDSGKYTCHPSNANLKTVVVHVLNGEHPAAMQHGGQRGLHSGPAASTLAAGGALLLLLACS
ncbi:zwei Ig domain protein zig-8-like [Schistocerca americana]|uniref:zwei Ig domain protein zig-8-like n=1 Tax=Schistocerca americana TaxID=7009 RepID=UPI001F4FF261|nr:zwei Ig domain protein zig-8-like [Schistocerca americana]XP_049772249.1 zwei Ig domain protein zig-8-like [Schistocerca cancellata]XP_049786377.1 zwei Ig domain protein zig-8-like [Schistocerca cancellata]XP_049960344.1 zwei Ig domain protein zig-8-like [Schistocerca serialis cubense]